MKKGLAISILICFLFSFFCGCTNKPPLFLPGEQEADSMFVWVCKKPFGFFSPTDDLGNKYYGDLKGYFEDKDGLTCFYMLFNPISGLTDFIKPETLGNSSEDDSFCGRGDYHENYFDLEIVRDQINFLDGEFPTLRFEKMTKDAFLEEYGEIENVSELLE